MALDAIAVIANAFLDMNASNVVRCVLVAAIAGIAAVVFAHMASHARNMMVVVELEIFEVIESRRFPFILFVALAAIRGDIPVQRVAR